MSDAAPADKISKDKTIYQVSYREIFWRNFVAGAGRAIGGALVYIIFTSVLLGFFIKYLGPIITPMLEQISTIFGTLQNIPRF